MTSHWLTHWKLSIEANISYKSIVKCFILKYPLELWLKLLTHPKRPIPDLSQHWFGQWLAEKQVTSHCPNQCWRCSSMYLYPTRPPRGNNVKGGLRLADRPGAIQGWHFGTSWNPRLGIKTSPIQYSHTFCSYHTVVGWKWFRNGLLLLVLTHCPIMAPDGDGYIGRQRLRWWLVVW